MRCKLLLLLISCALTLAGCNRTTTTTTTTTAPGGQTTDQTNATTTAQPAASPQASAPAQSAAAPGQTPAAAAPRDACALLTSDDIREVQGEAIKDAKSTQRADSSFAVAQCFYTTPTFTKSVSLELTQGAGGKTSPRDFWRENFARAGREGEHEERDRDRDRDKDKGKGKDKDKERGRRGEEEEEGGAPPTRIAGIGDDAYWVNSRVSGALYVLKGDKFIRISLGGADNDAMRQKKARALAQKALARL